MGFWGRDLMSGTGGALVAALVPASLTAQAPIPLAQAAGAWMWIPVLMLGAGAAAVVILRSRHRASHRRSPAADPPLLFPAAPASQPRRVRREPAPIGYAPASEAAAQVPVMAGAQAAANSVPVSSASAPPPFPPAAAEAYGPVVEGHTIRFHQPTEGTLQILPGRLEIVAGAETGHSIRFVRTPGPPEITFGRSEGPAYRHIQLRAPTVSRKHAQMRYDGYGWALLNLSSTNPVVINGEELDTEGEARPLTEGDRIEMGEVVFVFRER